MTVSMTKTAALFTGDMANVLSYSIAFVCHFCDLFVTHLTMCVCVCVCVCARAVCVCVCVCAPICLKQEH